MLKLIGLGLYDEKSISLKGLEEIKKSDKVYCELYTSPWFGDLKKLEKITGKKIILVNRSFLEEESWKIVEEAKEKNVALLVPGDPLVATTHISILLEAERRGVKYKVIHSSSVVSAIAETGLEIYKFGKIVTIPFLEKLNGTLPYSVYESIKTNKSMGLHTLCLLDVDYENKKFMKPNEAANILLRIEAERREKVITPEERILVACKLGSENSKIYYLSVEDVVKKSDWEIPAVIVIIGKLHFIEKEKIERV